MRRQTADMKKKKQSNIVKKTMDDESETGERSNKGTKAQRSKITKVKSEKERQNAGFSYF